MTETAANELHFEMMINATCFQPISVKITNQSEAETRGSVETVHMKSEQQKQTETKVDLEERKEIHLTPDGLSVLHTNRERKAQEQLVNSRVRNKKLKNHLCCFIKWIYTKQRGEIQLYFTVCLKMIN